MLVSVCLCVCGVQVFLPVGDDPVIFLGQFRRFYLSAVCRLRSGIEYLKGYEHPFARTHDYVAAFADKTSLVSTMWIDLPRISAVS